MQNIHPNYFQNKESHFISVSVLAAALIGCKHKQDNYPLVISVDFNPTVMMTVISQKQDKYYYFLNSLTAKFLVILCDWK